MTHDPFKEKAEREAAKRAGKITPVKAAVAAPVLPAAGAVDHFAPKRVAKPVAAAPKAAAAVEPAPALAPAKSEVKADTNERVLSNGAPLKMVPSNRIAAPPFTRTDAMARQQKPAARASSLVLVSGAAAGSALATMADAPADEIDKPVTPSPAPSEPPAMTPAPVAPAPAPAVGEPVAATPAPATPVAAATTVKTGGGSGGGGRGGSGGGRKGGGGEAMAAREKMFDQDDLVSVVLVVGMLLIALLMFFQSRTSKTPADDRMVSPQMAANTAPPAPLPPDPYGNAPGDLTPKSPLPEAAPAPVIEAPVEVQQTPPAPAPAPAPTVAQPVIPACAPGRMVRAYFCTAKSDLTPAAREALDREVVAWKACAAGRELVVTGYADTRGDSTYNTWLGGLRATTVSTILRDAGLTVTETTGVGELPGLDDGKNCANQRRVDVMLKDGTPIPPSTACAPPEDEAPIICP